MREKHLLLFEEFGDKQIPFGFASFDKLPSTMLRTEGRQEQILRRFAPQDDSEGLRMKI